MTGEGGLESVHLKEAYLKHPGDDILGLHRLDVCSARPNVSQENLDRNYTKYLRPASDFVYTSLPSSRVARGSV